MFAEAMALADFVRDFPMMARMLRYLGIEADGRSVARAAAEAGLTRCRLLRLLEMAAETRSGGQAA